MQQLMLPCSSRCCHAAADAATQQPMLSSPPLGQPRLSSPAQHASAPKRHHAAAAAAAAACQQVPCSYASMAGRAEAFVTHGRHRHRCMTATGAWQQHLFYSIRTAIPAAWQQQLHARNGCMAAAAAFLVLHSCNSCTATAAASSQPIVCNSKPLSAAWLQSVLGSTRCIAASAATWQQQPHDKNKTAAKQTQIVFLN